MLLRHVNYHDWSPGATFVILLLQLFKTVHLPCRTGGLAFLLNRLRAGGYCVALFVLFFMWFHVLYHRLSSCVMMRKCYESIFGIVLRGRMLNYPMDLFCGVAAVTVVLTGLVGSYSTWLHNSNTLQDDHECAGKLVATLIWLGLLGKMVIEMVFILWQSVLLNGSFIARTTAQTTVNKAPIHQFTRELLQLQRINVVLLFDQLSLILFGGPLSTELQFFSDSRWFLVVYYTVSLALISRVRSRLRKAITKTWEDGGEEQKDVTWFEAGKENVFNFVNLLIAPCPDHHMGKYLLIHVTFTWFAILLSAYNGNNGCFLWSLFHFSAAYVFLCVNCRLWRERTNRTDVTFRHFILALLVVGNAFYILWNLGSCSGQDRGLWYFCLILNVVMTAVFVIHQAWRGETIDASSSYILIQTNLYFAAVFTSLALYVFLSSMQAENFSLFNPGLCSFLFQFLLLVEVLLFACVWNPTETTPQQDSGGMTNASVHNGTRNPGSTVDSGTSFSYQPPVNPSHEKQD